MRHQRPHLGCLSISAVGILKKQAETPLVHLFAICSLTRWRICFFKWAMERWPPTHFWGALALFCAGLVSALGVGECVAGAGSESWVLLFLPVPGPPFPGNTPPSFVMITKAFFNTHLKHKLNYCSWFHCWACWYLIGFGHRTATPMISLSHKESKDTAWRSRTPPRVLQWQLGPSCLCSVAVHWREAVGSHWC